MTDKKLYADRDIIELDDQGGHYVKHVMAMTSEKLHSKSDIAAELAFRDSRMAELESRIAERESSVKGLLHNLKVIKWELNQVKETECSKNSWDRVSLSLEFAEQD